jgi:serine/threonine protein phosphatase PrpC
VPLASPTAVTPLARNDVLLLCTDGLWGPLTPQRLLAGFIGKELTKALADLLNLAEERAGLDCDNLSAIAMHWQTPALVEHELAAAR